MKLNSIIIQNYKSFKKQIIKFNEIRSGLHFVEGRNLVEPELGSNGSGKSSFADAPCWCLYGKDTSGLKAGDIGNWEEEKDCFVECIFDKGTVYRSWNPNSLLLDGVSVSQEQINEFIGLNYKSFLYSVIIGQFSTQFFDLRPADKLKVFSEVLGLDFWEKCSDKAKEKAKDDIVIYNLDNKIKHHKERIKSLQKFNFATESKKWMNDQNNEINSILDEISTSYADLIDLDKELELLDKQAPDRKAIDSIVEKNVEYEEIIKELRSDLIKSKELAASFQERIYKFDIEIHKYLKSRGNCPYCEQEITQEYVDKKLNDLEADKSDTEYHLKACDSEQTYFNAGIKEYTEKIKFNFEQKEQLQDRYFQCAKKKSDLDYLIANSKYDISRLSNNLDRLETEENPFVHKQEQIYSTLEKETIELAGYEEDYKDKKELIEIYKYWVKGFKEIRLLLIKEAVTELEISINNAINELGLKNWSVSILTEKESGSKGLFIYVKSPYNDKMVRFECWSGGERSRLRLAGTLGLMDFISNRLGVFFDMEFFDEPTSWLGIEGIDSLLEILKDRAAENKKKIFIIDHRVLDGFDFNGRFLVEKTKDKGSVVYAT